MRQTPRVCAICNKLILRMEIERFMLHSKTLCRKHLINTWLQPGAQGGRREKNRLNGFSWTRSWFTAFKGGVNGMISTKQFQNHICCAHESLESVFQRDR
jgi:hypothetical protein